MKLDWVELNREKVEMGGGETSGTEWLSLGLHTCLVFMSG